MLLSPQGRIEYAPAAVEDGQALWLIVEGAQAEPLTDYLNRNENSCFASILRI